MKSEWELTEEWEQWAGEGQEAVCGNVCRAELISCGCEAYFEWICSDEAVDVIE